MSYRHNHGQTERCDLCREWPTYAIVISLQLEELKGFAMTQQDDINTIAANQTRDSAILADVKTAVDQIKAANPGIDLSVLDSAAAGEGAAVAALAADVNVDQTPAPTDGGTTPVDSTPTA